MICLLINELLFTNVAGLDDLPYEILEHMAGKVYWKQLYSILPYINKKFRRISMEKIYMRQHPKEKPIVKHHVHFFGMTAYNRYLEVENNTWVCNCQTKEGRKKRNEIHRKLHHKKNWPF